MAAPLHDGFAPTLIDPDRTVPAFVTAREGDDPVRGFNVYRNNVVVSLVDALADRYPVCEQIVGSDFFRAMAREYVAVAPPVSPVMLHYGDAFADFIAAFPPADPVPYLADVARLEAARSAAYHAADAAPVAADCWAAFDGDALAACRFALHPSVHVMTTEFAAARIWAAHQGDGAPGDVDPVGAQEILIARPDADVETRVLPPGGATFIGALGRGATLAEAAGAASGTAGFDPAAVLACVIEARIVIAINKDQSNTEEGEGHHEPE